MAEPEYVILQLDDTFRASGITLENVPIPVRADRVARVMDREEVHLDLLLDELWEFLLEHEDRAPMYASFVGQLAYVVAMEMIRLGLLEAAQHYLEMGLKLDPDNISLLSKNAVALHTMKRYAEALEHYERALADESVGPSPLVRILAARCCKELALYEKGYRLLEPLIGLPVRDLAFVDFAAELAERGHLPVHVNDAMQNEISSMLATLRQSERRFCTACGTQLRSGAKFCGACGRPARPA